MKSSELVQNTDARVWAQEFCLLHPEADFDDMVGWFANSIMCGWDQRHFSSREYKRSIRRVLVPWWKRPFVSLNNFGRN
jgi:hypothetical protein